MPKTGHIEIRKLIRANAIACMMGETRWFATAGREHGLWYCTLHGFGMRFSIIGPFAWR